ncbi:hypothetical protein OE88DRAFT_1646279 [Heliocybe sulcata]|uniref:Secreted protein n=1 Tax=Heliocybe sulcata TaxID=5364 RepID=A0A5C3MWF1_9AGAM|nr:hypothetical protein OE88DRAFT_1646279 [Heliocybe sulcata]
MDAPSHLCLYLCCILALRTSLVVYDGHERLSRATTDLPLRPWIVGGAGSRHVPVLACAHLWDTSPEDRFSDVGTLGAYLSALSTRFFIGAHLRLLRLDWS